MVNTYTALEELEVQTSLIKTARANKIFTVDQPFTNIKLIHDISSTLPITGLSSIGVMYTVEWAAYLKYIGYSDITMLTHQHDANLQKICSTFGYKYILIDNAREKNMQFDALVGNPPYDRGIKTDTNLPFTNIGPHAAFSYLSHSLLKPNGVWSFVLPCNFMCLPTGSGFRQWVLNNYELDTINLYDNGKKEVFDINMSDVLVLTGRKVANPNNTAVTWALPNTAPFTVDMTKYDFWPMYKSAESVNIFDSVIQSKVKNLEADASTTPPQYYVSGNLTRMGQRQNPNPQAQFSKGAMKQISYPIWLGFSTQQELDYQYEWFGTKHYAYILSMLQSTTKNQPILFSMIGEHNFTNSDFDKHFSITPAQSLEIAQWHKTIA